MQFTILCLALLSVVAADVSHLNNKYLPPVLDSLAGKLHVPYVQETPQIPQASVQEVYDNSVFEDNISAQEKAQVASGQLVVSRLKGSVGKDIHNSGDDDQQVPNADNVAYQVQAYAQQTVAAEPEETTVSDSKFHRSTHQQEQVVYNTQVSQEQQKEVASPVEPLQQYHVKAYVKPEQTIYSGAHVEHHHAEHQNELNQQQADSKASAGIETQYAANGGYVY